MTASVDVGPHTTLFTLRQNLCQQILVSTNTCVNKHLCQEFCKATQVFVRKRLFPNTSVKRFVNRSNQTCSVKPSIYVTPSPSWKGRHRCRVGPQTTLFTLCRTLVGKKVKRVQNSFCKAKQPALGSTLVPQITSHR